MYGLSLFSEQHRGPGGGGVGGGGGVSEKNNKVWHKGGGRLKKNILPVIYFLNDLYIWDKVFKNGPTEICGRQPL